MAQWNEKTIKELGTFFSNNTFSRDCLNYESGKFQNVHYGDVLITFPDVLDAASPLLPYVNDEQTVTSEVFIEDGDIIVADTAEDETVGKVCEIRNVGDRKIVSGLHTLWFRPNPNEFAPKYLSYLLNSFDCHKQLIRKAHGIKVLSINKGDFWKVNVKYPSLSEQQAIAGIISKVDQCIENVQKSIEATQKLKKSLMQNLLTGRMKPDGTMRKETDFWEHPKMGKVPNGWEVRKVGDLIKLKNGKANVTSNLLEYPTEEYCIPVYGGNGITGYFNKSFFEEPKMIVGRVGEYCGNVFITAEKSWVTDNAMFVSYFKIEDYDIDFLSYKFNSLQFNHYSDTTGQPKITQSGVSAIKLYLPMDKDEQSKISSILNKVNNQIESKGDKIFSLKRLKKSLMQNLLTGQKRVDVVKINSLLESMN